MKPKSILKKILITLGTLIFLFFAIFIFHVITAKPEKIDCPNDQVSRIDFKNNIDSIQAKQICKDLRTIKGLTSDSIIVKRNVVVYFHNNTITNSEKVFNELMSKGKYDAARFILPPSMANKPVCPVDKNSFGYKLSKTVNHFFN